MDCICPWGRKELDTTEWLSLYLFCFWLWWVFVAVCGLLIVVASLGFSLDLVTLGAKASAVSAHGLSCTTPSLSFLTTLRGPLPFLDQGSNWCPCIAR